MTPKPDQNAVQSPAQDSAAQQGGTAQPGGAQRSARSLMNSLYRSPRARNHRVPRSHHAHRSHRGGRRHGDRRHVRSRSRVRRARLRIREITG